MLASGVTAAMVAIEFSEVAISTLSKAAMTHGMSQLIYAVYSNAFAIFILLPATFIFYRKRVRSPITLSIISKIFLQSLIVCGLQYCINFGVAFSSPTLVSAMTDLTPAFTFLLAIVSRMEKLDLRVSSSQAKSIGTLVSIAGALIVTLYKGLPITSRQLHTNLPNQLLLPVQPNWVLGGILCASGAIFLATLYIVQTWIIKEYPEELTVTLITSIFVTVISAIVTLIAERDLNVWTLKPDIELIAICLSAVFSVSVRNVVHTWACRKKGPVYTAMFKPLGMVIAMIMGVSFLGDTLYLGSVIGAVIIAFGFYAVIWGKAKEEKGTKDKEQCSSESSSPKSPLLQERSLEV